MIDLIAFIDCETSGLWRSSLPIGDPAQPNLLELACRVEDDRGRIASSFSRIIRPDGWGIEAGAVEAHGITERFAHECGVARWMVLAELQASLQNVTRIVAHNFHAFDRQVIETEIAREKSTDGTWWHTQVRKSFCTMEAAKPILKLPGRFNDHKFPSLEECVEFFGADVEGWEHWMPTHRAADDVDALAFVYKEIVKWNS